jgi:lipopolysaccharide export LptBFGC system permease protein LptF
VNSITSLISRVFFFISFVLMALALIERFLNFSGYTILGGAYTPGRLLEAAGLLMIFVIAILLRQIRDSLRKGAA